MVAVAVDVSAVLSVITLSYFDGVLLIWCWGGTNMPIIWWLKPLSLSLSQWGLNSGSMTQHQVTDGEWSHISADFAVSSANIFGHVGIWFLWRVLFCSGLIVTELLYSLSPLLVPIHRSCPLLVQTMSDVAVTSGLWISVTISMVGRLQSSLLVEKLQPSAWPNSRMWFLESTVHKYHWLGQRGVIMLSRCHLWEQIPAMDMWETPQLIPTERKGWERPAHPTHLWAVCFLAMNFHTE